MPLRNYIRGCRAMRTKLMKLDYEASLQEMLTKLKEKKATEIVRIIQARTPNENTCLLYTSPSPRD